MATMTARPDSQQGVARGTEADVSAPPRDPGGAVTPFVLLAASLATAIVLVTQAPERFDPAAVPWFVALTGMAVAIRVWGSRVPLQSRRSRMAFWATMAVTLPLVLLNPAFGLYAFIGYPDGTRRLRGIEGVLGIIAVAIVCSLAQTGGVRSPIFTFPFFALFLLVNLVVASSMTMFDRQRQRTSEALAQANASLREAQARNLELQDQLVAQAREAGVTQERSRLAREIHDTIAQDLVAIIAQLSAASGPAPTPEAAAEQRRRLDQAEQTARSALAEARRSVQALSSPRLDTDDLPAALGRLLESWQDATGATAHLTTRGRVRAGGADEVALRIAQEALANAAHHAGASSVRLLLDYEDDALCIEIADDGTGFHTDSATHGHGLRSMRDRARQIGGECSVESAPGAGTRVRARLPGRWR